METSNSAKSAFKVAHVAAGYLAGCAVAVLVLLAKLMIGDPHLPLSSVVELVAGTVGIVGVMFLAVVILVLPGFVAMRLLLHVLKRNDWPSYAVAGGFLGLIYTMLFFGPQTSSLPLFLQYPPSSIFTVMGVFAGIASWLTESRFARQPSVIKGGA